MSTADDIAAVARTVQDRLRMRSQTPPFADFADTIFVVHTRFVAANEAFVLSARPGSAALLAAVESARVAVDAMQPAEASVRNALATVDGAADHLERATAASSGNFMASLRGSLRIAPDPADIVASAEPPTDTSIFKSADAPSAAKRRRPPPGASDPTYFQKLTNLFPAEALALYGTGVAIYGSATPFVVLSALVVLLLLRIFATQPKRGGAPRWTEVLVAVISYLLWTTATDPAWLTAIGLPMDSDALRRNAAFLGAALVFVAPLVISVDRRTG